MRIVTAAPFFAGAMLRSEHLVYQYANRETIRFPDVSLDAQEQLLVLGPSGSGKSTLLNLWSGQLALAKGAGPKNSGRIVVNGVDLHALSGSALDRWRGRHVGMVYQRPRLLASQRVASNIELQCQLAGNSDCQGLIVAGLDRLGIAHLAQRFPSACSLGEQQRVGILRALIHRPALILADEPTSALDRSNALAVAKLLQESAKEWGAMLVVVTHDERIAPLFSRKLELTAS